MRVNSPRSLVLPAIGPLSIGKKLTPTLASGLPAIVIVPRTGAVAGPSLGRQPSTSRLTNPLHNGRGRGIFETLRASGRFNASTPQCASGHSVGRLAAGYSHMKSIADLCAEGLAH